MELGVVIIFFASVLAVVFGQQQCRDQRKCMPFRDCAEYQPYVDQPSKFWPQHVQNEVKGLTCGMEQGESGKICCKSNPVVRTNIRYPKPPAGKSGHDLLDLKKCGKTSKSRITHGTIAEVFEFPWMALLGNEKGFYCGGSLIAESFVLTAAHCSRSTEIVRVGETDLSKEKDCIYYANGEVDCAEPYQDINVAKFISHPLYGPSKTKHDIALVKLAQPAQLNDNVRPICLPLPEKLLEDIPPKMTVSGWGHTEFQNQTSNELRYANLLIVEPEECQLSINQLQDFFTLDESQVCAGGAGDLKDNCRGDSGGPLQYFARKAMVIHGIIAFGLNTCGIDSSPGVYTKVSHYLGWIIDNLK